MKKKYYARRRRSRRTVRTRFFIIISVLVAALAVGIFFIVRAINEAPGSAVPPRDSVQLMPPDGAAGLPEDSTAEPTEEPTPTPAPSLSNELMPYATRNTDPATVGVTFDIMVDGTEVESYQRPDTIMFGSGDEYTELEGITTFRGNNYRDQPSWGTVTINEGKLELKKYDKKTSAIGRWGGAAWTGQPLIVKWPEQTRRVMTSLYEEFRDKDDFVEVIYATLDGRIYFMELQTGKKTRDFINIGSPTKGTPSIDPRGYPIIYVGQGLQDDGDATKCKDMYFRAYSLIDGKLLMKFGAKDKDPFAYRGWQAYDSSALVHGDTDTLIVPGENGVLYTLKLNTVYDPEAGTLTMDESPKMVKYRYTSKHNEDADSSGRWGMENSAVAWRNYLFFTDNAGIMQCVNLNTMELVYANNLDDDSDVTMVLEEDIPNQTFYLYTGCEYDELVRPLGDTGPAYARKLDGLTGEILWTAEYTVKSTGSVDGGVLASPVLGREGTTMDGLIIFNVTAVVKDDTTTSYLVALDKMTGEEVWRYDLKIDGWSPSSPVPVYTEDGKGYIVQCNKAGDVALIDGATGAEVATVNVGEGTDTIHNFEATPAIYGNTIVVASRRSEIFFIEIK